MALIAIVDRDNNVIGRKARSDLKPDDIYTASSLWIRDMHGRVLLSQRAFTKKNSPGQWGPSVAGTIEYDETSISNVIKEAKEELGLTILPHELQKGPLRFNQGPRSYFSQSYIYICTLHEDDFIPQNDEVVAIKWFALSKIDELLIKYPEMFTSNFAASWALLRPLLNSTPVSK